MGQLDLEDASALGQEAQTDPGLGEGQRKVFSGKPCVWEVQPALEAEVNVTVRPNLVGAIIEKLGTC